eukprot:TRINITY_DN2003_c0_g1::TRINITY_DN2003_c0_g1_i1::g.21885::m.21885 TRINITY_DN2003_c0_g1::TRINITY_DN2003_c0_g1_i1::g.21885  ORF type:complete len:790 (+),score=289.63,sp/F4I0P8/VP35B_ARATH/49.30/0.0,Vps35/PF03635.12/1e-271,LOH1CR12/PF10158.4/2,LOH1CR12/PF10158.4/1.4e+02 TRINITY_DN2003_c0_g1_i1:43-2370(+)
MATAVALSPEEEQEKWLEEACNVVKQQAFYMKRALDQNNLRVALQHASSMITELRTSLLSPKNYYELYMQVFDELRHLEAHFVELQRQGKPMYNLYELVQHAVNILPRLYLLVTVGSVYIRSKEAPAKDILKDIVEMSKGVQHPQRGLFLRTYLSQMAKDKLPDTGSEYEGEGGSVVDSVDFVLTNFTEMNKLWVRMQHQGPLRDKEKREKERQELRLLVGTNLVRLSQLDGVDLPMYKETVLPRILEQVINCKDAIAQEYLAECIIQVFPDEFHLHTLESFLNMLTQLQPNVNVKRVLVALMDRLANFGEGAAIPDDIDAFGLLLNYITKLVANMELPDILVLQVGLVRFALRGYPKRLDYIDHVLGACSEALTKLGIRQVTDSKSGQIIVDLLTLPLQTYSDVLTILDLQAYPALMSNLAPSTRKSVAKAIVQSIVKTGTRLENPERVEALFGFIEPLLVPEEDGDKSDDDDQDTDAREEFEEEQNLVARMIHLLGREDDNDSTYKILSTARKMFGRGGEKRIRYTLPPLVFAALKLSRRILNAEDNNTVGKVTSTKILQFCQQTVTVLIPIAPSMALRLFLQCAQACNVQRHEELAYEFLSKSYEVYEEELADSKAQISGISVITATLQTMRIFSEENYDTLAQKTTQYSAKQLKKPDQCRGVLQCTHLFWVPDGFRDGKRVLECIKRSLKIAEKCVSSQQSNVSLFIDILNTCLYYYQSGNSEITTEYLQALVQLINDHLSSMDNSDPAAQAYYTNTIAHIRKGGYGDLAL